MNQPHLSTESMKYGTTIWCLEPECIFDSLKTFDTIDSLKYHITKNHTDYDSISRYNCAKTLLDMKYRNYDNELEEELITCSNCGNQWDGYAQCLCNGYSSCDTGVDSSCDTGEDSSCDTGVNIHEGIIYGNTMEAI